MYCHHCKRNTQDPQKYVQHVKACLSSILATRTAAEASARYFQSVYKQARFHRATPKLLVRHYEEGE